MNAQRHRDDVSLTIGDENDMMSTEPAQPDAGTNPETMTIEEISRELAAYRPGNAAEVIAIEEWLARRMQLWRRLDQLARSGAGGQQ